MKNILFLCVANSARSQMAEALARDILGDVANIQSAGSEPSHVHPCAITALSEINISTDNLFSKNIDTINLDEIDYIVTLCAEEYCPYVSKKITKYHWPITDPAHLESDVLNGFRNAREMIKDKIIEFKNIL